MERLNGVEMLLLRCFLNIRNHQTLRKIVVGENIRMASANLCDFKDKETPYLIIEK